MCIWAFSCACGRDARMRGCFRQIDQFSPQVTLQNLHFPGHISAIFPPKSQKKGAISKVRFHKIQIQQAIWHYGGSIMSWAAPVQSRPTSDSFIDKNDLRVVLCFAFMWKTTRVSFPSLQTCPWKVYACTCHIGSPFNKRVMETGPDHGTTLRLFLLCQGFSL